MLTLQCFVADDVVCEKLHRTPVPELKVKEVNLQSSKTVLETLADNAHWATKLQGLLETVPLTAHYTSTMQGLRAGEKLSGG